ncbi:MAG: DUF393 domain-containing protein [Pseudomonadota bacterium]
MTESSENCARDTLYYDGACPLCSREIDEIRAQRGDAIALIDVHDLHLGVEPGSGHGDVLQTFSRNDLLKSLHLQRADGRWLRGADANVAAWEGTARWQVLRVLRWPLIRWCVDRVYAIWANVRFRRMYGVPQPPSDSSAPSLNRPEETAGAD